MATLTFTLSQFAANVKAHHTGSAVVGGAISVSATICPSSIIYMVRVPSGATITDYWLKIATGGGGPQTFQMGTSFSPSGLMSVTTLTHTFSLSTQNITAPAAGDANYAQNWLRAPGAGDLMPLRISLSDDAQPSYHWIRGNVGAGCSASAYLTLMLWYTVDGLLGHTELNK